VFAVGVQVREEWLELYIKIAKPSTPLLNVHVFVVWVQVQDELGAAQAAVEVDMADGAAIAEVVTRSRLEEENAHRRALRSIVTNVQLKDISSAQVHVQEGCLYACSKLQNCVAIARAC
jgi:peptide deformylase